VTDAFDADVLIYAAQPTDARGRAVAGLFALGSTLPVGVGSVLLVPELLAKPLRLPAAAEHGRLTRILSQLDLYELDRRTAELATALAAELRLKSIDAIHLATALETGADRFITTNRRDFPKSIEGIEITYPDDLPEPS
jgi:predicted nucleic acid-binding protein